MSEQGFAALTYRFTEHLFRFAYRSAGLERIGEHSVLISSLPRGGTLVDLGAHRGAFYLAAHQRRACQCVAVEAAPELFHSLPPVAGLRTVHAAIHWEDCPIQFNLANNAQASSANAELASRSGVVSQIVVEGRTLATLLRDVGLDRVNILKVDIEGAEIALFETSGDAVLTGCDQISVEFHDFLDSREIPRVRAILARMCRLGFQVLVVSSEDHREVLLLNRHSLELNTASRVYLRILQITSWLRRTRAGLSRNLRRARLRTGLPTR